MKDTTLYQKFLDLDQQFHLLIAQRVEILTGNDPVLERLISSWHMIQESIKDLDAE